MVAARNSQIIQAILFMLIVMLFCPFADGKIIYVDDDAAGADDGTSWADAYKYLQDALADANSAEKPVEIKVAQGIYKPDLGGGNTAGDREATFQLINDVILKGSFAGFGELDPDARDVAAYETILSGDLNGDDVEVATIDLPEEPTRGENSYHVVTGSSTDETAVLDDFTTTGGNASGFILGDEPPWDYRLRRGGGMYNYEGSPTLTNCTFSWNSVYQDGGGMYNYQSSPTLTNCTFSGNSAVGGAVHTGGGMCNGTNSSPTLTNCIFSGNLAQIAGGGMRNLENSNPTLTNCILWGNTSFYTSSSISGNAIISYSNIQGGFPGEGNIDTDPLFLDLGYWHDNNTPDDRWDDYWVDGDYHLKSQAGRFDQTTQVLVKDDVTSPCIDAGDPLSPVMYEPHPRGCIINMGAYGGTEEASKSPFNSLYELDGE